MLNKADINALFGTSGISLKKMYKKASECLDKKEDLFIDFGSGAEQIDSVIYDPYSKRAVFCFANKHGDIETFCSTSDTRLRVLKMGDETQLHLEHARKMKFD